MSESSAVSRIARRRAAGDEVPFPFARIVAVMLASPSPVIAVACRWRLPPATWARAIPATVLFTSSVEHGFRTGGTLFSCSRCAAAMDAEASPYSGDLSALAEVGEVGGDRLGRGRH